MKKHWIIYAWLGIIGFHYTKAFIYIRKGGAFLRSPLVATRERRNGDEEMESQEAIFDLSRREFVGLTGTGAVLGASIYNSSVFSESGLRSNDREEMPVPFSSFRRYKSIKLSNGIRCLLVNDKAARQSSCALTIGGAGQFSDTKGLNGLAHLMEHMTLSSTNSRRRGSRNFKDFDEWLSEFDGYSNGFTAFEKVCFHFNCPNEVFQEALGRFARLLTQEAIVQVCQNNETLKREIRRIDSELDASNINAREIYLLKSLINPDHPWARNTAGNLETLEKNPAENGIDVSERLIQFFKDHYQPTRSILVLVSPVDISSLENWVLPFSSSLSRSQAPQIEEKRIFPEFFSKQNKFTTICLYRGNPAATRPARVGDDLETLSFYWALTLDYSDIEQLDRNVVTAPQVGFVLSQILGRRGPGSLYNLLRKRQWSPEGSKGVPRLSFPVDVSGFQLMKLEVSLTQEGFASRSAVIAAVYDSINALQASPLSSAPFQIRLELIREYMTVAQLYGYVLSPRPSDAVELAFDGQLYGLDGPRGVGVPGWHRLPLPQNNFGVMSIQRCLKDTLSMMSDPLNAIVIATASQSAILASKQNLFDGSLPQMSPASWNISPITGARYYFDDMLRLSGRVNEWLVARLMEDELGPPVLNPLIPPVLRPPRSLDKSLASPYFLSDNRQLDESKGRFQSWKDVIHRNIGSGETRKGVDYDPMKSSILKDYWAVLSATPQEEKKGPILPLPRTAPEPSCRCVFVLQLLSTRPARANVRSAAHAELWRVSLEAALSDLAELGAPAGLAYELSFNKYGMRICFLGLSQNLPSYARRVCRRIVEHQTRLLESGEKFTSKVVEASIRSATSSQNISPRRKKQIISLLREASPIDSAIEGIAFFKTCRGGVCFSQGDLLPKETIALLADLKGIFRVATGSNIRPNIFVPALEDIAYRPNWIPRSASSCLISGSTLISDACGRVPR